MLMPLLKEHNLVAFIVNEDWIIIRRKTYIDIIVEDQPYNSVEVLLHSVTQVRSKFKENVSTECVNSSVARFARKFLCKFL